MQQLLHMQQENKHLPSFTATQALLKVHLAEQHGLTSEPTTKKADHQPIFAFDSVLHCYTLTSIPLNALHSLKRC